VNLNDVCVNHPGEAVDSWCPLGLEDWSADDGPVCVLFICFLIASLPTT
jgi:hypothetical protein